MKKLFKHLLIISLMLITIVFATTPTNTYATNNNANVSDGGGGGGTSSQDEKPPKKEEEEDYTDCRTFLGMPSWDCHLRADWRGEENLKFNIWQIAKNIAEAITKIVTYLLTGYVIYGGYLYIFSSGDPTKAAASKKTITRAFIGLAVVVFANIIISSVGIAMLGSSGAFDANCIADKNVECVKPETLITNVINWVIGIAGVVSAVYVVIGGIGYITSAGDPNKLQKAKTTIVYSLLGLAIVGLSLIISNSGRNIIQAANTGDDIKEPILNLLNSIIGFLSVVSVIFIIKGGFGYMTSSGDPGKLKSAKDTILYACIGLIICVLSFAIVNWAIGVIGKSTTEQPPEETSINQSITIADV